MRRWTLRTVGAALAILLAGCGSADDSAPGGVSEREAAALNDAAATLDDNGQDAIVETNADAGADGAGNVE